MRMLLLSSWNQTGSTQETLELLATFPPEDLSFLTPVVMT